MHSRCVSLLDERRLDGDRRLSHRSTLNLSVQRQQRSDQNGVAADAHAPSVGVDHKLVHAARAEGSANGINHNLAGVDVGDELAAALARVCALAQQDNAGLLLDIQGGAVGGGEWWW